MLMFLSIQFVLIILFLIHIYTAFSLRSIFTFLLFHKINEFFSVHAFIKQEQEFSKNHANFSIHKISCEYFQVLTALLIADTLYTSSLTILFTGNCFTFSISWFSSSIHDLHSSWLIYSHQFSLLCIVFSSSHCFKMSDIAVKFTHFLFSNHLIL